MMQRLTRLLWSVAIAAAAIAGRADTYTVTTASDSGNGSFRWAVDQANSHAGADTILFAVDTVSLQSAVTVTDAVTIDGGTDAHIAAFTASPAAIVVAGPHVTVKNLTITNTAGGAIAINADGATVDSCTLGPNSTIAIAIHNAAHITITGTVAIDSSDGIVMTGANDVTIQGCSIGRQLYTLPVTKGGNSGDGIRADANTTNVTIGGPPDTPSARNIIANNANDGVSFDGRGAVVQGNEVVDNGGDGIAFLSNSASVTVSGNWVARNGHDGILITNPPDANFDNTGECNPHALIEAPEPSPLTLESAIKDVHATTITGRLIARPGTYVIHLHPQIISCPTEPDNFTWHPIAISVTTDTHGVANFVTVLPAPYDAIAATTVLDTDLESTSTPLLFATATGFDHAVVQVSTTPTWQIQDGKIVVTFTTVVTNDGPAAARDVTLTITPPPLAPADSSPTTIDLGPLAAGESRTLTNAYTFPLGTPAVRFTATVSQSDGPSVSATAAFPAKHRAAR